MFRGVHFSGGGRVGAAAMLLCCSLVVGNIAAAAMANDKGILTKNDADGLPPYTFAYTNGLYATIAGYLSVKDVELKNEKSLKLKIDSFKKKVPVKAVIQPQAAPLVVVLPGIDGSAESKLGRLWPSWFAQAGYHVLTFDSTFMPSFIDISGHGVTGNLQAESDRVKEIITAFLQLPEVKDKVTKIGVVGMSYGGIEALTLGREAADGKLPFKLSALQAYSPPINLEKTGELIDQWFVQDRWQYTLVELANKLAGHDPVPPNAPLPFSDSMLRAGIAAAFRLGLVEVVVRNDRTYKLNLLPRGNSFDDEYVRHDYAETWGYSDFIANAVYPYWQKKLHLKSFEELNSATDLRTLIPAQPAFSEVILAQDDPFNLPDDFAQLKKLAVGRPVTILPHGGHLGFVNDPWTRAKLLTLFHDEKQTTDTSGAKTPEKK